MRSRSTKIHLIDVIYHPPISRFCALSLLYILLTIFGWPRVLIYNRELISIMQRFLATDGHRKCTVFLFYLSSHFHFYIFKSLCASRDDYFENLGETNVLARKMFTSGCRPWLQNVTCLSSLMKRYFDGTVWARRWRSETLALALRPILTETLLWL